MVYSSCTAIISYCKTAYGCTNTNRSSALFKRFAALETVCFLGRESLPVRTLHGTAYSFVARYDCPYHDRRYFYLAATEVESVPLLDIVHRVVGIGGVGPVPAHHQLRGGRLVLQPAVEVEHLLGNSRHGLHDAFGGRYEPQSCDGAQVGLQLRNRPQLLQQFLVRHPFLCRLDGVVRRLDADIGGDGGGDDASSLQS